jgi:hypothetical protein
LFVRAILIAGAAMLTACQPPAAQVRLQPDEKLQISRAVWNEFEEYQTQVVSAGAFVVSETGDGAGYSLCPGFRCRPTNHVRRAMNMCQEAGVKCVLFAEGRAILVDYEIVD